MAETSSVSRELTEAQRRAVAELMRVSPVADELGRRFERAGHELHLVGGSVRDALLGRLGDDLDFATDPLRMRRGARFAAQLRCAAAPDVLAAMTRMASDLARITAERIRDEFTKLLGGADPVTGLRLLVDTGLADQFLPELPGLRLEIDEHAQHKDVYEHTLTVVRNAVSLEDNGPDFVLRMAALMHDVGKPATKAIGPNGRVGFHHHEVVGARLTRTRLRALKYPRNVVDDVSELVLLHLRFYGYGRGEWTDSAGRRYVTDAGEL